MSCKECGSPTGKHFRGCPVLWRDDVPPEAAGPPPPDVPREPAWEFAVRVFDEWRSTLAVEMFPDAEGLRFMNLAKKLAGEDGVTVAPPAPCAEGHVWSNDYGDDWTPEVGTPCDCRQKQWGVVPKEQS